MKKQSLPHKAMHVAISGRVQGVGYRAWLRAQARKADVVGWVRNVSDGSVEAHLCGHPDQVDALIEQCYEGPMASAVLLIEAQETAPIERADFDIIATETVRVAANS